MRLRTSSRQVSLTLLDLEIQYQLANDVTTRFALYIIIACCVESGNVMQLLSPAE